MTLSRNYYLFLIPFILALMCCNNPDSVNKVADLPPAVPSKEVANTDSLLFNAAATGNITLVKQLLGAGANVDARGTGYANHYEGGVQEASARNWTALMIASYNHHKEIAELLIDNGASIEAKNDVGNTALLYACQGNEFAIATLLLDHNADPNNYDQTSASPLYWALAYQMEPLAIHLIKKGANVNAISTETGQTVLMASFINELPEVGNLLIAKGANVNTINKKDGQTALMAAAAHNYVATTKLLLEKGADVNIVARNTYSALGMAAGNDSDDVRIPNMLLERGALINHPMDIGFTALSEAAAQKNIKIARLLIVHGADVNTVSKSRGGLVALYDAVFACDLEMSKLLIENGAGVNAVTENGTSILLRAVWSEKNLALVNYLLDKGAMVNLANEDGETPLLKSVSTSDVAMVKLLLANGASLNAKDVYGHTVYSVAKERGNKDILKILQQ